MCVCVCVCVYVFACAIHCLFLRCSSLLLEVAVAFAVVVAVVAFFVLLEWRVNLGHGWTYGQFA